MRFSFLLFRTEFELKYVFYFIFFFETSAVESKDNRKNAHLKIGFDYDIRLYIDQIFSEIKKKK